MNISPDNMANDNRTTGKQPADHELERRAREIYARACASVDTRTHARLAAARRKALNVARHPSRHRIWLPASGAFAAAALVIGVLWLHAGPTPSVPAQGSQQVAASDTDLPLDADADAEQLELYQNMDFYQWLAKRPAARASQNEGKQ